MSIYRPRILMFAPLCYPPAGSEAIVTSKLILAAIDAGWKIDVISQADFGHYYPFNPGDAWKPLTGIMHNICGMRKNGFVDRLDRLTGWQSLQSLSWAGKALVRSRMLSLRVNYDFILSRVAPQYGHLPALLFSRLSTIPWIANWSDPMPGRKAPPPYGDGPSAPVPFFLREYCATVARNASWHTFPCERLRKYFCSYLPELAGKSSVVPHVALGRFRSDVPKGDDLFSLCSIGSLAFRNPSVFLEGVRLFLQRKKITESFKVRFIGPQLDHLADMVRGMGLAGLVSIEDVRTYEEAQQIAASSTILVVIEAACSEGIFFPSKFVDFVQTGRPILAVSPPNGTLNDILSNNGGGAAVDCRSPLAVAGAIENFYNEWKAGTLDENHGSARLFGHFSERKVLESYMDIFMRVKEENRK